MYDYCHNWFDWLLIAIISSLPRWNCLQLLHAAPDKTVSLPLRCGGCTPHRINASADRDTPHCKALVGLCRVHGDAVGSGGHRRGKNPSWSPSLRQRDHPWGSRPTAPAGTAPGVPSRMKSHGRPRKDPPSRPAWPPPWAGPYTWGWALWESWGKPAPTVHPGPSPTHFGDRKDLTCKETPASPPPLGFYTFPHGERLFRDESREILVFSTSWLGQLPSYRVSCSLTEISSDTESVFCHAMIMHGNNH